MSIIIKSYYKIEFCVIPEKNTTEEWQELKNQYTKEQVEKKLTFYRQEFPGRNWRIWHVKVEEQLYEEFGE